MIETIQKLYKILQKYHINSAYKKILNMKKICTALFVKLKQKYFGLSHVSNNMKIQQKNAMKILVEVIFKDEILKSC